MIPYFFVALPFNHARCGLHYLRSIKDMIRSVTWPINIQALPLSQRPQRPRISGTYLITDNCVTNILDLYRYCYSNVKQGHPLLIQTSRGLHRNFKKSTDINNITMFFACVRCYCNNVPTRLRKIFSVKHPRHRLDVIVMCVVYVFISVLQMMLRCWQETQHVHDNIHNIYMTTYKAQQKYTQTRNNESYRKWIQ